MLDEKDNPFYNNMRQAWFNLRSQAIKRGEQFTLEWAVFYRLWTVDKWMSRGKDPDCYSVKKFDINQPWSNTNAYIGQGRTRKTPTTTITLPRPDPMLTDLYNYYVDLEDYQRRLRTQPNGCVFLADETGSTDSITRIKSYPKHAGAIRKYNNINANQVAIRLKYGRYIPTSNQVVPSCGDRRCCNPDHIDVPHSVEAPGLRPPGYNPLTRRVNCPTVEYGPDHPVRLALEEFRVGYPNINIDFDRIRSTYEPHYIIRNQTINNNSRN
jgi:hypothetical protein